MREPRTLRLIPNIRKQAVHSPRRQRERHSLQLGIRYIRRFHIRQPLPCSPPRTKVRILDPLHRITKLLEDFDANSTSFAAVFAGDEPDAAQGFVDGFAELETTEDEDNALCSEKTVNADERLGCGHVYTPDEGKVKNKEPDERGEPSGGRQLPDRRFHVGDGAEEQEPLRSDVSEGPAWW